MAPANKSIFDFFRKAPPPSDKAPAQQTRQPTSKSTNGVYSVPRSSTMGQSNSTLSKSPEMSEPVGYTSSLSPPPPSASDEAHSLATGRETTPLPVASSHEYSGRTIKSSDDEDSDSSLDDLATILSTKMAAKRPNNSLNGVPKTPTASRYVKTNFNFHTSPLPVLSKTQFDMSALMSHAKKDQAAEASSKRLKAMMAPKDEREHSYISEEDVNRSNVTQNPLLESVIADQEGGIAKVTRALRRTEATIAEKRWYFFDHHPMATKASANPFPKASALKGWEGELKDPQMRQQSFLSGFVEDMVGFGKKLPDELFIWVLDEAFLESRGPLRYSYLSLLRECPQQIKRLILPGIIQRLFDKLGATESASTITQPVKPVPMLSHPLPKYDWSRVCSLINFLGKIGKSLKSESREHLICMILRMSVDRAVAENVDLLDEVHRAIYYLSRDTPGSEWERSCSNICKLLLTTVSESSFRLQIVDSVPSGSARTHDLRRRLAMCFFFKDEFYSSRPPYSTMDIGRFITRLGERDFDARPQTEYAQLTALIILLDIAVDDGRSNKVDLTDPNTEERFNTDVDVLVATIKDIMTSIGNPGAAFISRLEAKEALELVSQRIADTVRTKKVVKDSWFDRGKKDELKSEQRGMSDFLMKVDRIKKEAKASTLA